MSERVSYEHYTPQEAFEGVREASETVEKCKARLAELLDPSRPAVGRAKQAALQVLAKEKAERDMVMWARAILGATEKAPPAQEPQSTEPITDFESEEFAFLSNFYLTPVIYDGLTYPSSEHAYQSAKTTDPVVRAEFTNPSMTPGQAKRRGKEVKMVANWEEEKDEIMHEILRSKFRDPFLRRRLLATGDRELIEGNTWHDTYWGVCNGKGKNRLGELLMKVREKIR